MHPPPARPQAPRYVQKADYGKVPGYLQHNKAQIAKEKARQDALLLAAEQVARHHSCTHLHASYGAGLSDSWIGDAPSCYLLTARHPCNGQYTAQPCSHELNDALVQERASRVLPEEERLQLVRQLKLKWAQTNTQFLRLPFTLDTPAKRRRKEVYEAQLAQLEKDIRLLQHNRNIMVTSE